MSPPSLVANRLTKRYGRFTALDGLNLSLEGSRCVGFLGPNGAGKTTALKMFTDMIFPSSGEAFINGINVRTDRKAALAQAGVLIETPEIYPSLTPREALSMVADLRGVPPSHRRDRLDEVLREVNMLEWADKKVGKFSKGMKQRINLAASLIHDPEVLLLDEPTTGLDPRGMAEVRGIIRGLKRGRRLIFMSSHLLSEVSEVCDEVALVNKGKLLFHESLAEVSSRFSAGSGSVDLGFAQPVGDDIVRAKLSVLPSVDSVERLDSQKFRVRLSKGGAETQSQLLEELVALHLGLVSFAESGNALEETYMQLVSRGD